MSFNTGGEAMPLSSDSVDVDSAVKAAIKHCEPALDRKLQELTQQGATSSRVESDFADLTQVLADLIGAASHDAPEGGEIVLALSPLGATVTVTISVAGAPHGPSRTLVLGRRSV